MKKSFILTFVLASFVFAGMNAQNISKPKTDKAPTEQKSDKTESSDVKPGKPKAGNPSDLEKGKPNGEARSERKGDNGKHKGQKKGKGKKKGHYKHEGHEGHEGHNHGKAAEGPKEGKNKTDKPKGRQPKQGDKQ